MSRQVQAEVDPLILRARPTNRDLARRDILQGLQSTAGSLRLDVAPFYYSNGSSKELLRLNGTVICRYGGGQYNIPVEIWLQQDHPIVPPLVFVRPTANMHISQSSRDVRPDGVVTISYLNYWRHPNSDLNNLLNAMSEAFSQTPPVYSAPSSATRSTPYPTTATSMPMPGGYGASAAAGASTSYSYPHGYPQTQIPENIYRESLQTAVLNRVRDRLEETVQLSNAEIESLRKTEQDLRAGEKTLEKFIRDIRQQQQQAESYIGSMRDKTSEMRDASQSDSRSSPSKRENAIKDDALVIPAPVYKQLLQAYAEEHAIQDLLYFLADGLRRQSIGLDVYLKHVRELSRKQFMLRATMHRCRQVINPAIK